MFKRSFLVVASIMTVVFASAFTSQMIITQSLPSSYDPGLTIDKALKSAKTPLLIEFYSDTCGTCQRLAPVVHELQTEYKNKLTLVMMDIDNPENRQIAQLFGVDELPGVFVFDVRKMRKQQIESKHFLTKQTLSKALDDALSANAKLPARTLPKQATAPFADRES